MEFHISALKEEYLSFLNRLEKRNIRSMAESQFVFWKKHLPFLTSLQSRSALSGLLLQTSNEFIPAVYLQYHNDLPSHFEYKARFVIGGFVNILLYWIETGAKKSLRKLQKLRRNFLTKITLIGQGTFRNRDKALCPYPCFQDRKCIIIAVNFSQRSHWNNRHGYSVTNICII